MIAWLRQRQANRAILTWTARACPRHHTGTPLSPEITENPGKFGMVFGENLRWCEVCGRSWRILIGRFLPWHEIKLVGLPLPGGWSPKHVRAGDVITVDGQQVVVDDIQDHGFTAWPLRREDP